MAFSIGATVSGKIGYASHQNSAPVIRELMVRNDGDQVAEGCRLAARFPVSEEHIRQMSTLPWQSCAPLAVTILSKLPVCLEFVA